jgi:hypothetical protein
MSQYIDLAIFGVSTITRKIRRSYGLLGWAAAAPILMLTPTVSAFAQEVAPSGAVAGTRTASDGQAGAPSGGPEEIVLTATRRSEKLQLVPIAIAALLGEQIAEDMGISREKIDAISQDRLNAPAFNEREYAILAFTRQAQSVRVDDYVFGALSAFYSSRQIVEAIYTIGC